MSFAHSPRRPAGAAKAFALLLFTAQFLASLPARHIMAAAAYADSRAMRATSGRSLISTTGRR